MTNVISSISIPFNCVSMWYDRCQLTRKLHIYELSRSYRNHICTYGGDVLLCKPDQFRAKCCGELMDLFSVNYYIFSVNPFNHIQNNYVHTKLMNGLCSSILRTPIIITVSCQHHHHHYFESEGISRCMYV